MPNDYLPGRRQVSPVMPVLPVVAMVSVMAALAVLVSQLPKTMVPFMDQPLYAIPAILLGLGLIIAAVLKPEIPFLVLVFLIPLEAVATFFQTRLTGGLSITGVKFVGIIAAGGWLVRQILRLHSGDRRVRFGPMGGLLTLYLFSVIISLFFTKNLFLGWYVFVIQIQLFAFLFLSTNFIDTPNMLFRTVWVYLLASTISASMAVFQRLGLIAYASVKMEGRSSGAESDPNYFALSLGMALFLALGMTLASKRKFAKFCVLGICALSGVGMLLSVSRGAVVAFGATLIYILVKARRWNIALLALVVAGLLVPFVPQELYHRLSPEFISQDGSAMYRFYAAKAAIQIWTKSPLIGAGQGSFMSLVTDYLPVWLRSARQVVHNTYLEVLAEEGLLGIVGFGGALVLGFRTLWRTRAAALRAGKPEIANLTYGVELAFFMLLIGDIFLSSQTEKQVWLMFGIIAALGYLAKGWEHEPEAEAGKGPSGEALEAAEGGGAP